MGKSAIHWEPMSKDPAKVSDFFAAGCTWELIYLDPSAVEQG